MAKHRRGRTKTLVTDARKAIDACAGMNIRLAARRITRFLEDRMLPANLSIAQFGLMTHIAASSDDTIGALAVRIGLDQSTLSRNLRALERDGLVEIATAEQDLRRRAVWLTEFGAQRLEAAIPVWRSAHAALARLVEPARVKSLTAATAALVDSQHSRAELR